MQQKTITVVIDEAGNSTVDLEGFERQGCDKALKDFQGDDDTKVRRKKAAYFARAGDQQGQGQKSGR
jgi:hypothetical protein